MKLAKVLTIYIGFQQAIGLRFLTTPRLLRRFCRSVGDVDIADVQPEAVCAFLVGKGAITRTWQLRFAVLSSFYRFAMSRGYVGSSPLPTERPQLPPPFRPYIYSTEEIKRLLDATDVIHSIRQPLQADTYRTLLLLLYGTGVRIGEALSLDLRDFDTGRASIDCMVPGWQRRSTDAASAFHISRTRGDPPNSALPHDDTRALTAGQLAL